MITTQETDQYCPICHKAFLTATATVNGDPVEMIDNHAILPFTVVNTPDFELPKTGSYGTWMYTLGGVAAAGIAAIILFKGKKREKSAE